MRGVEDKQTRMVLTVLSPDSRVPKDHPLRRIKELADEALARLSPVFDEMYSAIGRPSIPPERLLKASLLMALYTVRSERQFCEQLDYNLLFRWFLDMDLEEPSFNHSTFTRNRERLLEHDVAQLFFQDIVCQARAANLVSAEHFTVDGTLIEAWASLKSLRPKDKKKEDQDPPEDPGNADVDFRGEKRSNDTHESTTDPEARLARKGKGREAKLCYGAHALMENRHGLLMNLQIHGILEASESEAASWMLESAAPGQSRLTVGADKGYDNNAFVETCRANKITPHVACNVNRRGGSTIDGRTTRHAGYQSSQRIRKRIEEIFGWIKTVGNFRRTRLRGQRKTQLAAYLVGAAYNLLRIARLTEAPT